jgi:hypothetical protein
MERAIKHPLVSYQEVSGTTLRRLHTSHFDSHANGDQGIEREQWGRWEQWADDDKIEVITERSSCKA